MNILKIHKILLFLICAIILFSCSKDVYFSGISENSFNEIKENYQNIDYSKEDIITIIGPPMVQEDSDNLWIYRLKKEKGNLTIKNTLYNKTLKLKFKNNILESIEEINLN